MSVKIRLQRHGRKKLPFYRIVVTDKDKRRDGRFIELVGTLNPLTDPETFVLKEDRIKYWISVGGKPSDRVAGLLDKNLPGYLKEIEETRTARIRSKRAVRKAKAGGTKKSKSEAKQRRLSRAARPRAVPVKKAEATEAAAAAE